MRVLGIDPGCETTGWGVVDGNARDYRLLEFGAIRTKPGQKFPARLAHISREIEEVISRHNPDACALEDGFLATNVKVTLKLGQVRGVAMLAAERAALDIHEYSPRLVKQSVVGYGNAEKHQVQEMVRVLLSLKTLPEPQDAADALAVALCHFHHAGLAQRILATERRMKLSSPVIRRPASG
jgi:crossover junction endodeoxyribonuclease RuvC